jgi:indole-3-glycerol phosphate synthase
MINKLTPIILQKQKEVARLKQIIQNEPHHPLTDILNGQLKRNSKENFKAALQTGALAIIAEIKRKSPSKGDLASIENPAILAENYVKAGANAISILTDELFFGGNINDLKNVARAFLNNHDAEHGQSNRGNDANANGKEQQHRHTPTANKQLALLRASGDDKHRRHPAASPRDPSSNAQGLIGVPILRKDFIIDEVQIAEAVMNGADAILLIVAVLGEKTKSLLNSAKKMGIDVLVEVHDEAELKIAIESGAEIIGVNNRDLTTFEIDTDRAIKLLDKIPNHIIRVAESGILDPMIAQAYHQAGFDAVLIGEALVKSNNPADFIEACRHD